MNTAITYAALEGFTEDAYGGFEKNPKPSQKASKNPRKDRTRISQQERKEVKKKRKENRDKGVDIEVNI